MGSMSPIHWAILIGVVVLVFGGGGKISGLMGDFAKGIKSFKKGLAEDDSPRISKNDEDSSVNMHQEKSKTDAE